MDYLTYSGNSIVKVRLPASADVLYAPPALPGIPKAQVPAAVRRAFEEPLGMPPLRELVNGSSRVLIAFDDNCQPFPETSRPDIREQALGALLPMLAECGVRRENIRLVCAVALHRKMKPRELRRMVGDRIMREFHPARLDNSDAEDRADIVDLGTTEQGEPVQVCRGVVDSDLVIYLDSVQIPLNGGHKSVAVGLGTYESIATHHNPSMTADVPHVMQPEQSNMHGCIERLSRVIQKHARIMVMEAAENNALYPFHLRYLGKHREECNVLERLARVATPTALRVLPEGLRRAVLHSVRTAYAPVEIHAGAIEPVHARTLAVMDRQLRTPVPRQYSTLVFGLPDLSPYAVDARINPVLVVSDMLGYLFNWFYRVPLVKRGGVVIILNPVFEVFHPEYHVAYERFYREVLSVTADPFEMRESFQEKFARDPYLRECYRHRYAHHGFHPFTVWYWATYALKYLSKVILVGPPDDRIARRLGVSWAPNVEHALGVAREITGGDDVVAQTIPPFFYCDVPGVL
ncbi:MAG TPA: lactate racemase domain-containing protein [Phycisphaerae bacterium]|nr:lactate racemase domain-containing protein [Phycisphaerae bacterium]HNU44485.1 lactate racemase domain-containing protein [Phycisphaerae bacterium]